jgi:hypothetical protein
LHRAGVAQLVERQPSKLNVAGSNPVSRSKFFKYTAKTFWRRKTPESFLFIKEIAKDLYRRAPGKS